MKKRAKATKKDFAYYETKIRNIIRSGSYGCFVWNPYAWAKIHEVAARLLKRKVLKRAGSYSKDQVCLVLNNGEMDAFNKANSNVCRDEQPRRLNSDANIQKADYN